VILGLSPPDLGTSLERARTMPVTRVLDTGFRDGLVPPADWDNPLRSLVRTVWRLYRYRVLLHDLLIPSGEPRMPILPVQFFTLAMMLEHDFGPDRARELLALRAVFERSQEPADFIRYVESLRGRDYLEASANDGGSSRRSRSSSRRCAGSRARACRRRPAGVAPPAENPLLASDPVVGSNVTRLSTRSPRSSGRTQPSSTCRSSTSAARFRRPASRT
jgi:hypothetical protein